MTRALALALASIVVGGCAVGEHRSTSGAGSNRPAAVALHSAKDVPKTRSSPPELITLEIGGMTCQGCVARVQHQLACVPGVYRVDVSLADQRARILADAAVADTALTRAVRRAGSEYLGIVLHR